MSSRANSVGLFVPPYPHWIMLVNSLIYLFHNTYMHMLLDGWRARFPSNCILFALLFQQCSVILCAALARRIIIPIHTSLSIYYAASYDIVISEPLTELSSSSGRYMGLWLFGMMVATLICHLFCLD